MIFSYLQNMQSHPSWVCGLKLTCVTFSHIINLSHPSWVCGLKHTAMNTLLFPTFWSHPSWVCGLKPILWYDDIKKYIVTPFVGVWIETHHHLYIYLKNQSHPSWVCGLKHVANQLAILLLDVTPFVGVWIET